MKRSIFRKRSRGYTVVEIMAAMTLFAIGAAGVISMQRVTIQGGADARAFDVATNIAREWQTRLNRDSMFWTEPNAANPFAAPNISQTKWLNVVTTAPLTWTNPPATTPLSGNSGVFDLLGRDVAANDPDAMFCAQYRLAWIADPGTPPKPTALMRAEVRVYWSRSELDHPDCAAPNPLPDDATALNKYHFVYLATALRGNPSP